MLNLQPEALKGIKVLDLTSALSGPFGTMFFADYGAEVIKIEPVGGEQCRSWGPFDEKSGESGYFASYNRNKKGVTLNLKDDRALQMFYDLVKEADVIWENYKGGVTKKLKIDYETCRKINPKIIYVSGSGFGQTGPIAHRPAYDIVAQSMGGIVNITGFPESVPTKAGPSIADHVSGIYQCVGALIALFHRERTGVGQWVDVSMMDTIFSLLENTIPNYTMAGVINEREGNIDPSISPFDIFECKDGYVALGVGNNNLFRKFATTIGREDLLEDEKFKTNDLRCINYKDHLQPLIREWTMKYTKAELEEIFDKASIPCGPVLNIKEAIEHPQIKARDMIVKMDHPAMGEIEIQGVVAKLSETPGGVYMASPMVGQHNCEVFGLTEEEAKALHEDGVI